MPIIPRLRRIFFSGKPRFPEHEILPLEEQISAWRGASKKMKWGIHEAEFESIGTSLRLPKATWHMGLRAPFSSTASGTTAPAMRIPFYRAMMSERINPFMALADYDVAPYGFSDFFDIPQLFSSNRVLGLGVGNMDRSYREFGIPMVRF